MNLAVVGSRSFKDNFKAKIEALYLICDTIEKHKINHLVSGGAAGPDQWGEEAAGNYHLSKTIYKPDWKTYGKSAGMRRNRDIINDADYVLLFWDGKSRGTSHDIMLVRKNNKPYALFVWQKTNEWREIESTLA
jgi:hypothetical protein